MDDYYCECPEGRNGKNCNTSTENAPDPCSANPCGSDGICFTASKIFKIKKRYLNFDWFLYNRVYFKQMGIGAFVTMGKMD